MFNSTHEYEACVLVNGKPVTEVVHNERTFIEGRKNSVYELQFRNNTGIRVLIVPSVDGLNVLDGKPCGKESSGYVVGPWETIKIPGWKVDGDTAAKFIFKPQDASKGKDKTYAEAMGQNPENQGVIGFMVFREKYRPPRLYPHIFQWNYTTKDWPYKKRRSHEGSSYSESWDGFSCSSNISCSLDDGSSDGLIRSQSFNAASESFTASDPQINVVSGTGAKADPDEGKDLGTGFGKATEFRTITVDFEKESETPVAVFSFYYNTLKNLRKMGVPVEQFNRHYQKPQEGPNPFPLSPEVTSTGCQPPAGWRKR